MVHDQYKYINYQNSDSVMFGHPFSNEYKGGADKSVDNGWSIQTSNIVPEGAVTIYYDIYEQIIFYRRFPDSLLTGLSKIGGLFFFFSIISALLYMLHSSYFTTEL